MRKALQTVLACWLGSTLIAGCTVLVSSPRVAVADYIQASRNAFVRAEPREDADVLTELNKGERLALKTDAQKNGYYAVTLPNGEEGWVYRTLVRRYRGELPVTRSSSATATSSGVGTSSWDSPQTASPAMRSFARGIVYASDPIPISPDVEIQLLDKKYFKIGYSNERGQPLWTSYAIGPVTDFVAYPRRRFATDRDTTALVTHDDYTGRGYSRGHMAPRLAISTRYGKAGNDATFVMSNVCPQFQDFNDGPWGNLEEWIAGKKNGQQFVKGWGDEYGKVWVTVGPIFSASPDVIADKVEIPSAYYCIVIDEDGGMPRSIAFIMDHKKTRESDLVGSLHSIDEIELLTGLDFFSELPDAVEDSLESSAASAIWPLPAPPN